MADVAPFRPGDIIDSARLNGLLDALNALEVRVAELENRPVAADPPVGVAVRIDRIDPVDVAAIGSRVSIFGEGFAADVFDNVVEFILDGQPFEARPTANSTQDQLIVVVPDIVAVGLARSRVTLRVSHADGQDQRPYDIYRLPLPQPRVEAHRIVDEDLLLMGGTVEFTFEAFQIPERVRTQFATLDGGVLSRAAQFQVDEPVVSVVTPILDEADIARIRPDGENRVRVTFRFEYRDDIRDLGVSDADYVMFLWL